MPTRRTLILAALATAVLGAPFSHLRAQVPDAAARAFIEKLGNETIQTFSDPATAGPQAVERFRGLLHKGFDVPYIGRWVLGRYWAQATPAEQAEYLSLFEKLIVDTYATRFAAYGGYRFRITGSRVDGEDVIVSTQIYQPNGPATSVEWRVRTTKGESRIIDVSVEGLSMGVTQRSEFGSVIQSSGSVAGLIKALKKRVGQG